MIKLNVSGVNYRKLHPELLSAGVEVIEVAILNYETVGDVDILFSDGTDMNLVQSIINAHDPTPIPQPLSEIEKIRLEQAQANSELVQLIMMLGGA